METEKKNIKNYSKSLWIFIIFNFCVFLFIISLNGFNLNNLQTIFSNIIKNIIFASLSSLITFILNGILPPNIKAILVFWRIKNVYPGCRAFTNLLNKDIRIDKETLTQNYGELPTIPEKQNKLWYKIYKENEYDPMIFDSHKNFLLSRDLTGLSFIFLIIYPIAIIFFKYILGYNIQHIIYYVSFLVIQYIVLLFTCRNYGNSFVCNALAKASISKEV